MSRFHAGNLMVWIITVVMSFASSECLGQEFTLKAGNAEVLASGSVDVPIYIDVNTGVGASTIDFGITYRGFLTLTSISEGSALTGLNGGAGAFQFLPDTADDGTPTTPSGAGTGLKGASLSVIIPDLALPSPDFLTLGADQEIAVLHFTDGSDKPSAISDTEFTNSLSGGLGAVVIEITDDNTTTPGTYNTPAGVALVNGEVLVTTPPVTGFTCMQTDPCACTVSLDWTNGYLYDTLSLYKDSVDPANLIDTFLPSGGVLAESYVLTQTNPTTYILVGRSNGVDSAETSCTELSDCTDPDSTPPVINGTPADMPGLKTDGGLCTTTVSWTDPTATDNCPPDPTPSYEVTEGGTADPSLTNGGTWPAGTYVVTFSAMDVNGNDAVPTSFNVTVSDNEAPEILDTPDDQFAYKTDGGLCTTTVSWTDPTATDNCSPVPTPTYEVIEVVGGTTVALTNGGSWSAGIYLVTFNATDVNGNDAGSTSFNVTVSDNEDPEISGMPANITEKNDDGSCDAVVSWTEPTDSDNCPGQGLSSTHNPGATFPVGSATTVTYTSTDAWGNSVTASFTVTINDNEDPVISGMPANITQKNDAGFCDAEVTWTEPTDSDNCPGQSLSSTHNPGDFFPVGSSTTVTYTSTDASSNSVTASFTVTINDNEDPVISGVPADITQKNDAGSCDAVVSWTEPTDSDNCPGQVLSSTHSPGATFPVGSATTVTYTSTDASGNSVTDSFTVTINDNEDPSDITGMPLDITQKNDAGNCDAVVTWTEMPSADDNCAGTIAATADMPSGSTFSLGDTIVTYTATDAAGNMSTATFTVTINDNEDPSDITGMPLDITQKNDAGNCDAVVTWTEMPSADDNCAGTIAATADMPSGSTFSLGDTIVTYTATDAAGNMSTATFTVTINDNEDPSDITGMPLDITQKNDAGNCDAVVTWTEMPSADDNCAGTIDAIADMPSGSTFSLGDTIVTYTATDAAGNMSTATFMVTVNDNENPGDITGMPADIKVDNDDGSCDAVVTWAESPSADDNCDGTIDAIADMPSGSTFVVGDTIVTYTATDAAGNMSTATFMVTVNDNEAPVVVPGAAIVVTGDGASCTFAVTVPLPSVSDNCGIDGVTNDFNSLPDASGDFPYGTTSIGWFAFDVNGNLGSALGTQTITVNPPIDCNGNDESDGCDISNGTSQDCNSNGIPDECDIAAATSFDNNSNGVPDECEVEFVRGDANNNGNVNVADAYWILLHVFFDLALDCNDAADVNNDGAINLSDAIYMYSALVGFGPVPPPPFPDCGLDTGDNLGCDNFDSCP